MSGEAVGLVLLLLAVCAWFGWLQALCVLLAVGAASVLLCAVGSRLLQRLSR